MKEDYRLEQIVILLAEQKLVKTVELMKRFDVSGETIRRDLIRLEQTGILRRVYGGAVSDNLRGHEITYASREASNLKEKQAIGQAAAELVQDGETIVLNSGTTTMEVARWLCKKRSNLIVITNCIYIAVAMQNCENARIFLVGGELRREEMATSGALGNAFLSRFRADKAIISIGGIDACSGVTDYHIEEACIWRDMIAIAGKVIVVADHTKFGISALNVICDSSDIDYLVTDWSTPGKELNKYKKLGTAVIAAPEPV